MVGSLALERFRLEEELGSGAFGTVHRAWDSRLRREVAVKAITISRAGRDRVLREAHAAARLSHPGIVALYEFGIEGKTAFMVTELVEGEDLCTAFDEDALADSEIAELGIDLCEALDHAHSRGVIHRDLKPANVLLTEAEGRAKLLDFGVAHLIDEAGPTVTGDMVGTLAYMAPEQVAGLAVGPETDVYALALLLHEGFSGDNPNRRDSMAATVEAIGRPLPSLARQRRDLPGELIEAIDFGLEVDPADRVTVEEIGRTLERCADGLSDRVPAGEGRRARLWPGVRGVCRRIRSGPEAADASSQPRLSRSR